MQVDERSSSGGSAGLQRRFRLSSCPFLSRPVLQSHGRLEGQTSPVFLFGVRGLGSHSPTSFQSSVNTRVSPAMRAAAGGRGIFDTAAQGEKAPGAIREIKRRDGSAGSRHRKTCIIRATPLCLYAASHRADAATGVSVVCVVLLFLFSRLNYPGGECKHSSQGKEFFSFQITARRSSGPDDNGGTVLV